jgi:hypothetical protein
MSNPPAHRGRLGKSEDSMSNLKPIQEPMRRMGKARLHGPRLAGAVHASNALQVRS